MKKIVCMAAAALILGMSVPSFAAYSSVTVKNNISSSKPVSYSYDPENTEETVKSIKTLMTKLNSLTRQNTIIQTLTVTSESVNGSPVDMKLRLTLPDGASAKTPTDDELSAFDYYNITINSSDGKPVYSYESDDSEVTGRYKDIPLGTFNTEEASDTKGYNVSVAINGDIIKSSVANIAKKMDWSIVSDTYAVPEETVSPETPSPSAKPSPSAVPSATPAAMATPAASGVIRLVQGEYVAGEDIKAGRYTMTGSGKVNVYTPEGVIKTTVALKGDNSSSNGVSEYVINISDGEKLVVESEAQLAPYVAPSASPTPSASPKATATPKATSKPAATAAPAAAKTNPKTGDNAPIACVSAVGLLAIAGAVLIAVKRKKNN